MFSYIIIHIDSYINGDYVKEKNYTDPRTVLSPRSAVSNLNVLFDDGPHSFSVATLDWHGVPSHAFRWNGHMENDGSINKGSPISTGHPVWMIIPKKMAQCIDFESLFSNKSPIESIANEITEAVVREKNKDPESFSVSVRYEATEINDEELASLKELLSAKSIILVNIKRHREVTVFNVAY